MLTLSQQGEGVHIYILCFNRVQAEKSLTGVGSIRQTERRDVSHLPDLHLLCVCHVPCNTYSIILTRAKKRRKGSLYALYFLVSTYCFLPLDNTYEGAAALAKGLGSSLRGLEFPVQPPPSLSRRIFFS